MEVDSIEFERKIKGIAYTTEFNPVYFDKSEYKDLIDPNEIVYEGKKIFIEMVFPEFTHDETGKEHDEYTEIVCIENSSNFTRKFLMKNIIAIFNEICMERYDSVMQYYNLQILRIYRLEDEDYYRIELA